MIGLRNYVQHDLSRAVYLQLSQAKQVAHVHVGRVHPRFWNLLQFSHKNGVHECKKEFIANVEVTGPSIVSAIKLENIKTTSTPRSPVHLFHFEPRRFLNVASKSFKPDAVNNVDVIALLSANPVSPNHKIKLEGYKNVNKEDTKHAAFVTTGIPTDSKIPRGGHEIWMNLISDGAEENLKKLSTGDCALSKNYSNNLNVSSLKPLTKKRETMKRYLQQKTSSREIPYSLMQCKLRRKSLSAINNSRNCLFGYESRKILSSYPQSIQRRTSSHMTYIVSNVQSCLGVNRSSQYFHQSTTNQKNFRRHELSEHSTTRPMNSYEGNGNLKVYYQTKLTASDASYAKIEERNCCHKTLENEEHKKCVIKTRESERPPESRSSRRYRDVSLSENEKGRKDDARKRLGRVFTDRYVIPQKKEEIFMESRGRITSRNSWQYLRIIRKEKLRIARNFSSVRRSWDLFIHTKIFNMIIRPNYGNSVHSAESNRSLISEKFTNDRTGDRAVRNSSGNFTLRSQLSSLGSFYGNIFHEYCTSKKKPPGDKNECVEEEERSSESEGDRMSRELKEMEECKKDQEKRNDTKKKFTTSESEAFSQMVLRNFRPFVNYTKQKQQINYLIQQRTQLAIIFSNRWLRTKKINNQDGSDDKKSTDCEQSIWGNEDELEPLPLLVEVPEESTEENDEKSPPKGSWLLSLFK